MVNYRIVGNKLLNNQGKLVAIRYGKNKPFIKTNKPYSGYAAKRKVKSKRRKRRKSFGFFGW